MTWLDWLLTAISMVLASATFTVALYGMFQIVKELIHYYRKG